MSSQSRRFKIKSLPSSLPLQSNMVISSSYSYSNVNGKEIINAKKTMNNGVVNKEATLNAKSISNNKYKISSQIKENGKIIKTTTKTVNRKLKKLK
jgi:hypothetical protein